MDRRKRHFYHHGHHMKNMSLGGIDPVFDRVMNTFVEVKFNPRRRNSVRCERRKRGAERGELLPRRFAPPRSAQSRCLFSFSFL